MARRSLSGALACGVAASLLTLAAPAAATKPVPTDDEQVQIWCTSVAEDLYVDVVAYYSLEGDWLEGWGEVWTPESDHWAYQGDGSYGDGAFEATWAFEDGEGGVVGTVTVAGTVEPLGEPTTIDERTRDGNTWTTVDGWVQQLIVSGAVTEATGEVAAAAGATFGCTGGARDLRFWGTNPATRVYRGTGGGAYCDVGEDGWLDVFVSNGVGSGTLVLGVDEETGSADLVAQGPLTVTSQSITGALEVGWPPPGEGEDPAQAWVDLAIGDVVDRGQMRATARGVAVHEWYTLSELAGTVEAPGYGALPITDCLYRDGRGMERYSSQAGQKPGGPPPVHDLPAGAVPLEPGAVERTNTRGAAEEPEAACVPDDAGEALPFTRTLWYSVAGTGGPVTLSTDGSHFNTVIGVYLPEGDGALTQLACVDNTATGVLAEVTFETESGVDYLIQIGGFFLEYGKLVVRHD